MSKSSFALWEGKVTFRLIFNRKDNTYDIENGFMQRLNSSSLATHDESMAFIHKYSIDNKIESMLYTLIER